MNVRLIAVVFVLPTLAACDLLSDQTILVQLRTPPMPVHWQAAFGTGSFELSWSASGSCSAAGVTASAQTRTAIELPRAPPVVLTATPSYARGRLAPAGAIWPLHVDDRGIVVLSFEHGATAAVLAEAVRRGADLRSFAVSRFAQSVQERLSDDPWQLDTHRLATAIAERSMRESYVRAAETFPVAAPVPAGQWFPASPFAGVVTSATGWPALQQGLSRFFDAAGRRIYVEIDSEGRPWMSEP